MLPNTRNINDLIQNFEESGRKTQTFGLNISNDTIGGKVDGLTALAQSIYLRLNTEADKYIIYPYTYGINLVDLIGKPSYYVIAVIPGRVKDALMRDDRVTGVSDFEFKINGSKLHIKFVVNTIYGEIKEEMVVSI